MPLGALADVDQAVLVAVDQRPQQHAADDAEDGGVGADAERQREDDGDGQALDPGQRPQREAEVGDEAHWWAPTMVRNHIPIWEFVNSHYPPPTVPDRTLDTAHR